MASLLRIEVRRNPGLWLFPLLVIAVWYLFAQGRAEGVWLWPDVSLSIESTVAVVGPLAAGLAAWTAGRNRRGGVQELLAITSYPPRARDLAVWGATAAWFVLAYVAAAGLIHLWAFAGGAWGTPVLWPVAVGLFALTAHSAVGYAAGYYLPNLFTAPLVAVALFLLQVAPVYFEGSVHHLAPLGESLTRSVFHGVLPNLFVGQALWFLGLTGTALATVAIKQRASASSLGVLLAMAVVSAFGVVLLLEKPPWASPKQMESATVAYEPVCVRREIPVCVHPAYGQLLPETAAVVGETVRPLVGVPGTPKRAEQINSMFADPRPDETLSFFLHDRNSLGDELASQVTGELVGYQTTAAFAGTGGANDDARAAVEAWLLHQAGGDPEYALFDSEKPEAVAAASRRFTRLTPEARQRWLGENYADLRAGKLTLEELP